MKRKSLGQDGWKRLAVSFDDSVEDNDMASIYCVDMIDNVAIETEVAPSGSRLITFKNVKNGLMVDLNGESEKEILDNDEFVHVDDFNDNVNDNLDDVNDNVDLNKNLKMKSKKQNSKMEKSNKKSRIFNITDLPITETLMKSNNNENSIQNTPSIDMSAWTVYPLHQDIIKGLEALMFESPTDIQRKVLSIALKEKRDIVGAAHTGSGKTLAFGLPMLNSYCQANVEGCLGLVIVPTRELAMQVTDHLKSVSKFTQCKTVSIVGGLSHEKQKRLLNSKPQIIVATPGRLWELISEEEDYLNYVKEAKYLVLDEADKMLESGRFKELEQIMSVLRPSTMSDSSKRTFLFSATLLDNTVSLKTLLTSKKPKKSSLSIQDLLQKMNFQDSDPAYVNLTAQSNTIMAQTLTEKKIDCLKDEKIHYLYYFLYTHPGRTVVFVNSIDGIRRLVPILSLLKLPVFGLHAEMQQRQRLKNLDRFRSNQKAILIASDVAARGLDIPNVDHVIHYQLPRTADLYVHRSGRTARANKEGLSIMLCSAEEVKVYRKICQILKHDAIPNATIDLSVHNELHKRMQLAKQINDLEHKRQKSNYEKNWLQQLAEKSELLSESDDSLDSDQGQDKFEDAKIRGLKSQLNALLAKPLVTLNMRKGFFGGREGMANQLSALLKEE